MPVGFDRFVLICFFSRLCVRAVSVNFTDDRLGVLLN